MDFVAGGAVRSRFGTVLKSYLRADREVGFGSDLEIATGVDIGSGVEGERKGIMREKGKSELTVFARSLDLWENQGNRVSERRKATR